ncbi:tetratricopeptide repeat protein [Bergeriella denitrificans]|uniref:Bacteriophage N4 receptor, outer membrane subunit n=1 Tax=Bergeriella denitrificans TaxID=494 RepID=A0A378UGK8_BERDE|nr:tetratricopeptide repeat protein [Bergeriella denitrificans]STZ76435.1 bacteriophage N4 receptor, outer membrane subunit [Bergeriella denitrificans]
MLSARTRLRALALAVGMVFAAQASAAADAAPKPQVETKKIIERKSRTTPEQREAAKQRRAEANRRANMLFSLLGGEMALQKGNSGMALATYMAILNRSKSPDVAERALEMAVSLDAFEQAETIYQKWREIEPEAGEAQRRMAWLRDLMTGKTDQAVSGLNDVLAHASEEQTGRIFLLLAQAAVQQPDLAEKAGKEVHKAALRYPDMPEAAIADVMYSAQMGKERHAVAALQRLAALDAEVSPPTWLALRLVGQRKPAVLNRFFADTDTQNLSSVWQELEISSLVAKGEQEKAYSRLQTLLKANPNADLYIQAALLAAARDEDMATVTGYLDRAYRTGTLEQQSRAAVIGAMRYADDKKFEQAKTWVEKINAPEYVFDKAVLSASVEAGLGNYQAALIEARRGQQLSEQQGRFFGGTDLQRVYLFALVKHDKPQEALKELNTLGAKVMKRRDSAERLPDILYQRAMLYERLSRHEEAVADLRRYVAMNPNSANGMNALGYTLLTSPKHAQHLEEAFRLIQAAYQLEPESAAINDSMGWAYYRKGDAEAALPYLEYAYRSEPDAEVAAHLGEVLWQTGERARAEDIWRDGLQREGNTALLKATMQRFGIAVPPVKAAPAAKKAAKQGK